MRPDAPRPDPAFRIERPAHPAAPAETVARQGLHLDRPVDAGQPGQLLGDDGGLEFTLQDTVGVLEVAPAAAARVVVHAGRLDPPGIGPQHPDHLAAAE